MSFSFNDDYAYSNFEEALQNTLELIQDYGHSTSPRGRGSKELLGHSFYIENPTDRIIGFEARNLNPFYLVGNFLWVMKQSNQLDFIKYYNPKGVMFSNDGVTLPAAYGKRIFDIDGINQWEQVIKELKIDKDSRRALINIHMAQHDWRGFLDTSCTSDFQFFIRHNQLHLINHMRSQSAAFVMPYDIFLMTMIHEVMAREVGADLGYYQHICNSIHYFDNEEKMVDKIIDSDDYSVPMPEMPEGSNMVYIKKLLEFEELARTDTLRLNEQGLLADFNYLTDSLLKLNLPTYWHYFGEVLIARSLWHPNSDNIGYKSYINDLSDKNPFKKLLNQMA